MAYIPASDSVIGFQSQPSSLLVGASIIGLTPVAPTPASVYVVNPVSTLSISTGNSSVQLLGGIAVIGSVAALQGTNPWVTNFNPGSVYVVNPVSTLSISTGNSSVQLLGGVAVVGSVAALQGTNPWIVNMPSPSIIAYQAAGSILTVAGTVTTSGGNSSVQLLQGVVAIGSVATLQGTNPWITSPNPASVYVVNPVSTLAITTGNSSVQLLGGVGVIGSVATLQGTNPWIVNVPTPSYISYQAAGSILAVSGSFSTGNSSVELLSTSASIATQVNRILTGVSSVQLMAGVNNVGSITAIQGTDPWKINVPSSSTVAYQLAGSIMAVGGTVTTSGGNSSVQLLGGVAVVGSVAALQGTNPWRIGNSSVQIVNNITIANPNSSVQILGPGSASIATFNAGGTASVMLIGSTNTSIRALVYNQLTGVSSVQLMAGTLNAGSITAIQGTNPWLVNTNNSSIITVGTYAEDATHTTADKGVFILGVRNDAVSSLTSATLDYSPIAVDGSGANIVIAKAANSSVFAVLSSITTVSILTTNVSRRGATIYNNAGTNLFVKLGTAATTSIYTVALNSNDYYEIPYGYTGVVAGITASTTLGRINVTELS